MRKKLFVAGLMLSTICLMACGKKDVKLDVSKSPEGSSVAATTTENSESLSGQQWNEEMTYTDADGKDISVKFKLTTTSEIENIKTINAKRYELTPENKEKFVKTIFGDAEVTSYYFPGDFWDYSEDLLESADGFEGNVFKGYVGEYEMTIKFATIFKDSPEALTNEIYFGYSDEVAAQGVSSFGTECSVEEQFRIVKNLFVESGLSESDKGIFAEGSDDYNAIIESGGFGYFWYLGKSLEYMSDIGQYKHMHNASIYFDEDRIMYADIQSPIIVTSFDTEVKLLSFSDIQAAIKKSIEAGNVGGLKASASGVLTINSMTLVYSEFEKDGEITVLPVWRLDNGNGGIEKMYVNAITGEVIE